MLANIHSCEYLLNEGMKWNSNEDFNMELYITTLQNYWRSTEHKADKTVCCVLLRCHRD